MSFWRAIALALALGLATGCAFDPSGSGLGQRLNDSGPRDDADAAEPPDTADAAPDTDALACIDGDDDGFVAPTMPGALCEPPDCDDADENVFPGQSGAFTTPKSSGDYDYNCDGVEERLADTKRGGGCHEEIFGPCEGTGWLDFVPECGQLGTWHRCEDTFFGCDEAEVIDAVMPCR